MNKGVLQPSLTALMIDADVELFVVQSNHDHPLLVVLASSVQVVNEPV